MTWESDLKYFWPWFQSYFCFVLKKKKKRLPILPRDPGVLFTKYPVCTNPVQVIFSRSKTEARQVQAQTQTVPFSIGSGNGGGGGSSKLWWRWNIFCTWKAKRKNFLLNSNNTRKENVNVKLPSELRLSPSALPLSTRPYDVTRVGPHDTLSLWRALTTPWQRAQKTSAAAAATYSATLHHRQQQHHNSPHQQPHTAMAGGLAHPTRYIPSPLNLLHATLYPCVHGGHVVSGLSANGSCTDEKDVVRLNWK